MAIAKPAGEFAEQMLEPGGWPEIDEDLLYDRAQAYTQVLRQVTGVLETCQQQRTELFDGDVWSGGAANAANGELGTNIDELVKLQNGLATVITWNRYVALSVGQTKSDITDIVDAAQRQIAAVQRDSKMNAAERANAINGVVIATHVANVGMMESAAERILATKAWRPPANALDDLLDQKTPPPVTLPGGSDGAAPPDDGARDTPEERDRPRPAPAQPAVPAPSLPGLPTPGGGPQTPPGIRASPAQPPRPSAPTPGASAPAGPETPGRPNIPAPPPVPSSPPSTPVPLGPATPAVPLSPAASVGPSGGATGKGVAPASLSASGPAAGGHAEDSSASTAPAGATTMPAAPMAAGAGGASAGAGPRSAAPVAQASSLQPATRPAAAARSGARPARAKTTEEPEAADPPNPVAPPVIIPVSAKRAERDAIADAATADATRRRGTDPLQMARRIGAALNAPGDPATINLGFFWVTAVTTGGAIVVANSYGVAFIPDGVRLPEQVQLASADDAVAPAERARWATYPMMAVQGWAEHHDTKLRAVIATEEQFAMSDPGVARIILQADDIPDTGAMAGRSRLAVVNPHAFDRLAATTDVRLIDLLPPASAAAPGNTPDAEPPSDDRPLLWFEVMKPLASRASGRRAAHLRAFKAYAALAEDVTLGEARTAADLSAQRSAVADWLYWKHLSELLAAAGV
ncbi:hypothetical protein A5714_06885 [Mycobacterium sp. E2462]|uniref:hypothetical protein n=1 Tax=Mycobacterium sp. E2462 TaxID=1834133 RepID=UPI0007FF4515|nr:hypothetical protein [Mycobacterium sp. E2462]OBI21802.1 hypothetical protein A5714_06885 [Mycobacterium sp. E2462]